MPVRPASQRASLLSTLPITISAEAAVKVARSSFKATAACRPVAASTSNRATERNLVMEPPAVNRWAPWDRWELFTLAGLQRGLSHLLTQAALRKERFRQLGNLAVQQVPGLVNQADDDVRHRFRRACFDIGPVGLISPIF